MNSIRKFSNILLLGILGCHGDHKDKPVSYTQKDREINKIKLIDLNEQPIDLKKYSGKTIFITFWATWCKPCMAEMPSIEKAQNILRKEEVIFLLASSENVEEIKEFKNDHSYKFNYARIENSEALNIQALPTTMIFDREGNLVFSEMGSRNWVDSTNIDMILKIAK
ncbi:TlpA family protein disulfide reductase [Pseudoflavitalea sp. X16]|uniref:TlpA family protein disulfide reductase n=1 Tax=Paraflavitalea devenefica TaxID=2716334 RepID=UPI0014232BDC|nr:TlpA disulfide reductase family protein [Paraflavitalea devenefica]NII26345.1 TlpA family protein disulfide reductase [Paraflavitalea devenefica]